MIPNLKNNIFMYHDHKIRFLIPLTFLLFIIYGSLIPFDIRSIPFGEALNRFRHIPFLNLGIVSRADWVANILLYIPFGFFLTGWLSKKPHSFYKNCMIFVTVFLFCILTAVLIEFSQIFFAPRTVSINDLIAETIGSFLGIVLWFASGHRLIHLWFSSGEIRRVDTALNALFVLYLIFILTIGLFPFDFLVSANEIQLKYQAWEMHPLFFNGTMNLTAVIRTMAALLLFAPVGSFIGIHYRRRFSFKTKIILTVCVSFIIAFTIEFLQFFTASGVSEISSVVVRVAGAVMGLFIIRTEFLHYLQLLKPFKKYLIILLFPIYLLMALKLSDWSKNGWMNIHDGLSRFDFDMILPFYYHYFSTETRAVLSVLLNSGMYMPIGFAGWLLSPAEAENKNRYLSVSVFSAIVLSLFIEAGKLFQKALHPDFTNIIIAVFSAAVVFKLSDRIFSVFQGADVLFKE